MTVGHLCQSQSQWAELRGSEGVCLRNTSLQLHTVSKSRSNGMSSALYCLDKRHNARARGKLHLRAFLHPRQKPIKPTGTGEVRRKTVGPIVNLGQERLKSPNSRAEEASNESSSFLTERRRKQGYAAGHVNLKGDTCQAQQ